MDPRHTAVLGKCVDAGSDAETHDYLGCEDQTHREAHWKTSSGDRRSVESSNSFPAVADVPLARGVGCPVAGGASHPERS